MKHTRLTLYVYTTDAAGKLLYWTQHIGFFPQSMIDSIAEHVNARGIAFHSDVANQTGRVDVVTCPYPYANDTDRTVRIDEYEPPRLRD